MKRITYVSRFARPFTESELSELGDFAAEKNRKIGVTSVLMTYTPKDFIDGENFYGQGYLHQ
jgi:hypothetical protein